MTDEILGGAPAAPAATTPAPASPAAAAPAKVDTGLLLDDAGSEPSGDFDWRAAASRGDAKKLAALSRFKDLGTLADAFLDTKAKLSQRAPMFPGEGAGEEEVAAFRQALGIPETADAYAFPGQWSEADKPGIDAFKAIAHSANMAPKQVEAIANWYGETVQAMQAAKAEAAKAQASETKAKLIEEMGVRDFERGVTLANQFLHDRLGEGVSALVGATLEDGTRIGNHPMFLKLVMGLSRDFAGDDLVAAVDAPGSQTVEARLDELYALMNTDKAKYQSESVQAEIMRLQGIQDTRAQRKAA